ncbi:hypothetical protein T4A_1235 [Trichinella pseudospiralis]|uniref:Uncharacterized protein n=1 Tax=Trichinella pseudospiralis TaxID=6337 RepID=A0A0V1ERW1_TRIPS|nr:hypothetical protein T4A_1235 [Trichinella pseudospiralis]
MNALRKTSRGALLKHNELYTILCEIEASIYDRALVFMAALTPVHLLISCELAKLPSITTEIDHTTITLVQ